MRAFLTWLAELVGYMILAAFFAFAVAFAIGGIIALWP